MALAIAAATPVAAQSDEATSARLDALFGAHEPYEAFLARLKDAVAAGDRRSVAAMIAYPLEAGVAGEPIELAVERDFLQRYDELITPAIIKLTYPSAGLILSRFRFRIGRAGS